LGEEIMYFETYLASEGFLAYQSKAGDGGMDLLLKNGVYFEFVPFNNDNFNEEGNILPGAEAISILDVEPNVDYALVISTCSGAWRYLIGDVIRFTPGSNMSIEISGRTKHYLSLCGEHLSVDNMTRAVNLLSDEIGMPVKEFAVAGTPYEGMFAHHWYLSIDKPVDMAFVKDRLDHHLKSLNDDYAVERNHALKEIIVEAVPHDYFIEFLKTKGKIGSQYKFPRVLKGEITGQWKEFLQRTLVNG
jgi:hypothetical protein